MKLWEVIKELTDDPTKKFVLDEGDRIYTLSAERGGFSTFFNLSAINGKGANISNLDSGQFDGNFTTDEDDWQPVRQPVTWQEAIHAWAEGKMVSYKYPQDHVTYSFQDSNRMMCIEKIKDATWYVED